MFHIYNYAYLNFNYLSNFIRWNWNKILKAINFLTSCWKFPVFTYHFIYWSLKRMTLLQTVFIIWTVSLIMEFMLILWYSFSIRSIRQIGDFYFTLLLNLVTRSTRFVFYLVSRQKFGNKNGTYTKAAPILSLENIKFASVIFHLLFCIIFVGSEYSYK